MNPPISCSYIYVSETAASTPNHGQADVWRSRLANPFEEKCSYIWRDGNCKLIINYLVRIAIKRFENDLFSKNKTINPQNNTHEQGWYPLHPQNNTHEQGYSKKTKNPRNSTHEMLHRVIKLDPLCMPKPSCETILPVAFECLWDHYFVFFSL